MREGWQEEDAMVPEDLLPEPEPEPVGACTNNLACKKRCKNNTDNTDKKQCKNKCKNTCACKNA